MEKLITLTQELPLMDKGNMIKKMVIALSNFQLAPARKEGRKEGKKLTLTLRSLYL